MLSTDFLRGFIEHDATIIDVGARDGDSLLPFLPILKENSQMIAFEPIKEEAELLVKMLEANNIPKDRFSCNQFAINSSTGQFDFLYDTEDRNGGLKKQLHRISEVTKDWNEEDKTSSVWDKEIKVDCYCWNDLEEELKNKMLKASFIKVDTEGSDVVVLKELLPVISEARPLILFERYPGTESEFIPFVNEIQYTFVNVYEQVVCMSPSMNSVNIGYNVPATTKLLDTYHGRGKDIFLVPFERLRVTKDSEQHLSSIALSIPQ